MMWLSRMGAHRAGPSTMPWTLIRCRRLLRSSEEIYRRLRKKLAGLSKAPTLERSFIEIVPSSRHDTKSNQLSIYVGSLWREAIFDVLNNQMLLDIKYRTIDVVVVDNGDKESGEKEAVLLIG